MPEMLRATPTHRMTVRGAASPGLPFDPGAVERWELPPTPIDPWMVLRLCRYRTRESVAPAIWEAAHTMATRAGELVEVRGLIRPMRVAAAGPGTVRLAEGPVFSGRAVSDLLADSPLAVPFVLTIGSRLETEAAALADRRELLEAFLLETAGWAAIEVSVRTLRLGLAARAREAGWRITHRLAPGYRDWPLTEQRALVGLLETAAPVVRVSAHGVLVPQKSISGVFGLAPARAD